jgi:hypothetical protein
MQSFPISVIISAVDKFTGVFRALGTRINGLHARITNIGDVLNRRMGFERFNKGLADAAAHFSTFTNLARTLTRIVFLFGAAGIAAAAFAATQINSYVEVASALKDNAERLSMTAERLQEYQFGARLAGIESDELNKALQRFNVNIGKAAMGSGQAGKLLAALGVSLKDKVTGRLIEAGKILPVIADKINTIFKDPAKRAAAFEALFGKMGVKLQNFLSAGSKGLAEFAERARKLGIIMSNEDVEAAESFGDTLDILKMVLAGVRNTIVAQLVPALQGMTNKFIDFVASNREAIKAWAKDFGEKLPERIEKAKEVFLKLYAAVQKLGPLFDYLASNSDKLVTAFISLVNVVGWLVDNMEMLKAILVGLSAAYIAKSIWALVMAFRALGLAMLLTPVGLIITAIALIAAGAYLLIKNWDKVKAWWSDFWPRALDAVKDFAFKVAQFLAQNNPFSLMFRMWEALIERITGIDLGAILGAKLPDWAQKLLGFGDIAKRVATPAGGAPFAPTGGQPLILRSAAAPDPKASQLEERGKIEVKVSFENLPPGARPKIDNPDRLPFNLDLGYNWGSS